MKTIYFTAQMKTDQLALLVGNPAAEMKDRIAAFNEMQRRRKFMSDAEWRVALTGMPSSTRTFISAVLRRA